MRTAEIKEDEPPEESGAGLGLASVALASCTTECRDRRDGGGGGAICTFVLDIETGDADKNVTSSAVEDDEPCRDITGGNSGERIASSSTGQYTMRAGDGQTYLILGMPGSRRSDCARRSSPCSRLLENPQRPDYLE